MASGNETTHSWSSIVIAAVTAYCILWWALSGLPFLDLPNHLSRAYVIRELITNSSSPLHSYFIFEPSFAPYILGDLCLVDLLRFTDINTAGRIWVICAFLLLPFAFGVYRLAILKDLNIIDNDEESAWITFVACYLATNWFFLSGFFNYQIGAALALLTLAGWVYWIIKLRERQSFLPSAITWLTYAILAVLTYLMHLAAFVFLGIILGTAVHVRLFQKRINRTGYLFSLLPLALISLIHVLQQRGTGTGASTIIFRSPIDKLLAFGTMFVRFDLAIDLLLFALFASVVLLGCRNFFAERRWAQPAVVEHLLIALALLAAFAILPVSTARVYDVDNRALPFLFLELLLLPSLLIPSLLPGREPISPGSSALTPSIAVKKRPRTAPWILSLLSLVLTIANIAYLAFYLAPTHRFLQGYQEGLQAMPEHRAALPIGTIPDVGRVQISLHAGAFYTALRNGYTPYLFSANRQDMMIYFRYRNLTYTPDLFWYLRNEPVNWEKVFASYDFLIITNPFDRTRLPDHNLEEFFSNASVTVFRIQRPDAAAESAEGR